MLKACGSDAWQHGVCSARPIGTTTMTAELLRKFCAERWVDRSAPKDDSFQGRMNRSLAIESCPFGRSELQEAGIFPIELRFSADDGSFLYKFGTPCAISLITCRFHGRIMQ